MINPYVRYRELSIPNFTGNVMAPFILSPSISAISFISSRIKESPNANQAGIHIMLIFPVKAASENKKTIPNTKPMTALPINGNGLNNGVYNNIVGNTKSNAIFIANGGRLNAIYMPSV